MSYIAENTSPSSNESKSLFKFLLVTLLIMLTVSICSIAFMHKSENQHYKTGFEELRKNKSFISYSQITNNGNNATVSSLENLLEQTNKVDTNLLSQEKKSLLISYQKNLSDSIAYYSTHKDQYIQRNIIPEHVYIQTLAESSNGIVKFFSSWLGFIVLSLLFVFVTGLLLYLVMMTMGIDLLSMVAATGIMLMMAAPLSLNAIYAYFVNI